MKKEIIYPIFLECSQFITDHFWINIFEELAYGQTPYGTYINKDFFCCNYKSKEFSYKIEKKDSSKLYNDIYFLLTNKLGLLSHNDKLKKKLDFHAIENNLKFYRQKWSDIRKKNIKDLLIENYVIKRKREYNLDIKQAKYLLYVIFIAMIFKIITIKDIQYENGEIVNIDGISFQNKKIILNRNIYDSINTDCRKCILIDNKLMSDTWDKYLTSLKKII